MAGPEPLQLWLHGEVVAEAREARTGKLTLQYTAAAIERWPLNTPVLSVSLPLTDERYAPSTATPYLEGLLPEGEARATLEAQFDVRRGDTHGLLAAIGRDCAGAVVVLPSSAGTPDPAEGEVQWLDDADLVAEMRDLPRHPLGAGDEVRVSLAGQQTKLLLVGDSDGRWGRPLRGYPSTHILKPEDQRYPAMAANEAFCLRLAGELGLTTVRPEVITVDGRRVLVVPRYDRARNPDRTVVRLHQEDLCQALAIDVSRSDTKYEAYGGPSLRQVADVLDRFNGAISELDRLVQVVTFTVVVGNADAHGRNLSLLHRDRGVVVLAPLYDVMSTIHYPTVSTPDGDRPVSTDLAMRVNGVTSVDAVTVDDLVEEAAKWPYPAARAREVVRQFLEAVPSALEAAATRSRGDGLPPAIVERIAARVTSLAAGRHAGAH